MRVLIADDSLLSRRLLEGTLRGWGYDVVVAADGNEAWKILSADNPPSLAVLDWMMPGVTGPELCRLVRKRAAEPYTYILLLTSRNEKDDVVEGMDSGADDYITKPFDKHELKVRLRAGTRIVDLQEQLVTAREALRDQATRDYLTHLWNRSSILDILHRELDRSEREGTSVGVVVADLDHFKSINDTYGHFAGDAALQESARRMQASTRSYDAVGRYGGEEFLIVLPGVDEEGVRMQAERMRLAISGTPVSAKEAELKVTCSFGCSSAVGGRVSAEALIRAADEGLYRAKRAGRNCSVVVTSELAPVAVGAPGD
ncbi:MAG TPA: diguanylate cyclase [Bryobacteraceae bacterium]|nr:diguanylate cyclase [Bryobacteraceae bacterium]